MTTTVRYYGDRDVADRERISELLGLFSNTVRTSSSNSSIILQMLSSFGKKLHLFKQKRKRDAKKNYFVKFIFYNG